MKGDRWAMVGMIGLGLGVLGMALSLLDRFIT
ncbi:hypothetical protein SAVIM338S_07247 [Streptomyces avidinii]